MRITKNLLFAGSLLLATFLFQPKAHSATKPIVYFGVSLRYHPITVYERYQPMMDYLTQHTPYRFELKLSRDYQEAIRFLAEGTTQVASIGDGGLMKAMLVAGAVPIAKPLNSEGRPFYRSCVIVPTDSPIRSVLDLKGKRIAFGYHHSTTGNLVPRRLLLKNGINCRDLSVVANLRHHSDVARAVLRGEYDAGFVKESTAVRFQRNGLRVLAWSEDLPAIPLVARKDAPKELKESITRALVKLDRKNPRHRKIMENWDTEYQNGFVPATAADYRELGRMFRDHPYGCSRGCHK